MLGVGRVVLSRLSFPHARRQDHHSVRHAGCYHPGLGLWDLPTLVEILIEGSPIWKHLDLKRLLERLAEEPFHLLPTLPDVRLQGGSHVLVLVRMNDLQLRAGWRRGLSRLVLPWVRGRARGLACKSHCGDKDHEQPATETGHLASLSDANSVLPISACSRLTTLAPADHRRV